MDWGMGAAVLCWLTSPAPILAAADFSVTPSGLSYTINSLVNDPKLTS
jgi:hypothetical protein